MENVAPHTYLDGTAPFMYLGSWAVGASHSTATLSPGGTCGLYGLRLMHRLNISLSCFGPRAGQAIFYCRYIVLTLTLCTRLIKKFYPTLANILFECKSQYVLLNLLSCSLAEEELNTQEPRSFHVA